MAKRTPTRSEANDAASAPAETPRTSRPGGKSRATRDVGAEVGSGQDQAGAMSDEFLGESGSASEAVQGEGSDTTTSAAMSSEPSEEDIRIRAYHRYLERGGGHGMEYDDWLEAERELKSKRR
jgi:hypothetical protein